jgi:CCR4-NOT transcription complex subunit 1
LPLSACAPLWDQARAEASGTETATKSAAAVGAAGGSSESSSHTIDWRDTQAVVEFSLAEFANLLPDTIRADFDTVLRRLLEDEDEVIFLTEETQLDLLYWIYVTVSGAQGIPASLLVERSYANMEAQVSLICWGLCQRRLNFLSRSSGGSTDDDLHPIVPIEGLHQSTLKLIQELDAYWRWGVVRVLECLLGFGDTPLRSKAQSAIEQGMREAPEVLACALAETPKPTSMGGVALREHALDSLLPAFLVGGSNPNSAAVARRVWQYDRAALIRASMHCWQKDRSAAARLLDVAQDLKAVPETLAVVRPYEFAIDLALLASRREYINLRKWLRDRLQEHGSEFFGACLNYLSERAAQGDAAALFSLEATATMLKVLTENVGTVDDRMREELEQLCRTSAKESDTQDAFPAEIEERANQFFQRIYAEKTTVSEGVKELQDLQHSRVETDDMVVRCIIHNLLDEYRFFSKYPDRELRITAELFGALIKHEVVAPHSIMFTLIMRYVLESLRKTPPNKMLNFGLMTLETFQDRLAEWPQYARYIAQMPHLQHAAPELFRSVLAVVDSAETIPASPLHAASESERAQSLSAMPTLGSPTSTESEPGSTMGGAVTGSVTAQNKPVAGPLVTDNARAAPSTEAAISATAMSAMAPFGTSTPSTLEALLRASREEQRFMSVPDTSTQDKVHFIFNNLSPENIESKVRECFAIIREEHWEYLAQYIVVKRASIEPNFQATYALFLEHAPELLPMVLRKSYENVRVLLSSEKIRFSTAERSLLKNIGMWIGSLTLARNRPILRRDLDIKTLILHAYSTGLLIAVIPFVCKVLDACRVSRIFRLPNPWLASVFGLLREIYELADLKLNLKFEVEVLCKNTEIDLHAVKPTRLLATSSRPMGRENPDFTYKEGAERLTSPGTGRGASATAAGASAASGALLTGPAPSTTGMSSLSAEHASGGALAAAAPLEKVDDSTSFDLGALRASLHMATTAPPPVAARAAQVAAQTAAIAEGVTVIPNLSQHITVNEHLDLFQNPTVLKRIAAVAIDRAIREFIQPVVERSSLVALVTTRELVAKDLFQADRERALSAGQCMAQALASSLAHITCKDPLRMSMMSHLRSLFTNVGGDQTAVEQAVQAIMAENIEIACSIIERAAAERASRELDINVLAAAMSEYRTPPLLQHLPAPLLQPPIGVYESFSVRLGSSGLHGVTETQGGKQLLPSSTSSMASGTAQPLGTAVVAPGPLTSSSASPGIMAPTASAAAAIPGVSASGPALGHGMPAASSEDSRPIAAPTSVSESTDTLTLMRNAEERFIQAYMTLMNVASTELQANPEVALSAASGTKRVLQQIAALVRRLTDMEQLCMSLALKVFRRLLDTRVRLLVETHVVLLKLLAEAAPRIHTEVAHWCAAAGANSHGSTNSAEDVTAGAELTPDILHALQRGGFDLMHPRVLHSGPMPSSAYMEQSSLSPMQQQQQQHALSSIPAVAGVPQPPPAPSTAMLSVPTMLVAPSATTQASPSLLVNPVASLIPPNAPSQEQVSYILEEWQQLRSAGGNVNDLLQKFGLVQVDSFVTASVIYVLEPGRTNVISSVDALAGLVTALARNASRMDLASRMMLLHQALQAAVQRVTCGAADPRPPARFLRCLASELGNSERDKSTDGSGSNGIKTAGSEHAAHDDQATGSDVSTSNNQVLSLFAATLHAIRPTVAPYFAFAWLELVSCPPLMPRMLLSKQRACWPAFQRLLVDALEFLQPFLSVVAKGQTLRPAVRLFYHGLLRVLLVVLHDFPELLVESAYVLCDYIPLHCVQLRNLVLSAFPSKLRLPDPFSPEVTIETATKISLIPRLNVNVASTLERNDLRALLEEFLRLGAPTGFELNLAARLRADSTPGSGYVVPLLNAVVLYVGQTAVQARSMQAFVPVFLRFAEELDEEGRFLLIAAMANHIRYPNAHTSFFALALLHLFLHGQASIREQVARVLVERLFAARPHPWGLLVVFLELIRNPVYGFWQADFIQKAPELIRLMDNVARTCLGVADARAAAAATLTSHSGKGTTSSNQALLTPTRPAQTSSVPELNPIEAPATTESGTGPTGDLVR